ncbi:GntR family transcriptional regulator [Sporosarcina luteola]|uniref:GntR family transcriptional regulator n=1 Tax=Sporosarcina luteola TaxID=582850 RepID=A0A511Z387_9BACL|nr:GntR family transcriptional regulator [Sporosarcina luteola]GEN81877.1 GntR family transcriptional regulator [Sporosarcina luteola]
MDKRRSTSDFVYDEMKNKIVQLEYEPNERLVEDVLASAFEVSRTPLRQAIARLEIEKLVIRKRNGRIYVASLSIEEAIEIYKVREVLEGLVAKEATLNMTPDILAKLEDTLSLIDRAYEEDRNADAIKYGFEFHHLLYKPSNNPTAVHFLNQIKNRIERYRQIGESKQFRYLHHLPNKEHYELFNLIKEGDENKVEAEMRVHIRRSLETTIDSLKDLV